MNSSIKSITKNNLLDDIFIIFPFWFPLIYISLTLNFPSISKYLFLSVLLLFAETHFASTWLFFFDKENWNWIKKNSYDIVFLPVYVLFIIIGVWVINPSLIILTHYLASGWHVTRQSIGLLKIYRYGNIFYKSLVYSISIFSLAVGLKNPGILSNYFEGNINLLLSLIFLGYILLISADNSGILSKQLKGLMPLFTGIFIYLPILFFENLTVATAVGVGMHWCQYLAIMWSTYSRKSNFKKQINSKKFILKSLILIILYSLIMTTFALIGMPDFNSKNPSYTFFYLIPLVFQLYHFYIDGFIWKFSDKHISISIKPYIFSK